MLNANEIAGLLEPYVSPAAGFTIEAEPPVDWPAVYAKLAVYLELILRWNARTNLTAIREPEQIVRRHFGESLFAALYLSQCETLLDFGSGAGLPGVPIQLVRPDVRVTLAESQGKKAGFLREVVRELELQTEVWAKRVEEMPEGRLFDVVAMRAVDRMEMAVSKAKKRAGKQIMILGTAGLANAIDVVEGFESVDRVQIPDLSGGLLFLLKR